LYVLLLFVTDLADMTARHAATLARLADAGERLAMKHAERALSADDPDVEARATAAFHRAARSVRQCLALEAKLVRDAARAAREDHNHTERETTARRLRRKLHARAAVGRLIWTEAENEIEAERFESEIDDLLDLEDFSEGFDDEAAEALIARLARDLGLPAPSSGEGGRGAEAIRPAELPAAERRSSA
jgi:hypothetical protein